MIPQFQGEAQPSRPVLSVRLGRTLWPEDVRPSRTYESFAHSSSNCRRNAATSRGSPVSTMFSSLSRAAPRVQL